MQKLELHSDGAQLFPAAALHILKDIENTVLTSSEKMNAGSRITGNKALNNLLNDPSVRKGMPKQITDLHKPVRATLFDKNEIQNWSLGWHQDRTIALNKKHILPEFKKWSLKQGIPHVEPPFEIIDSMITVRIRLDDVTTSNAPLLIAVGSHRLGKILEGQICEIIEKSTIFECLAVAGDIWSYSTPILHSSSRAMQPSRRRVLQVDFSDVKLPSPLTWCGI